MKKLGFILALFAITVLPCLAADSPFAGTWKLNTDKSKFTGDTFTYSTTPSRLMHFSDGAIEYDFGIDGKVYPTLEDHTTTWVKVDDHTWNSEARAGDKPIFRAHRVLSADGKTLVMSYQELRPDGTTNDGSNTYTRVSGGPGLAGTWKDIKAKTPADTITIAIPSPGQIVFEDPAFKMVISGPTDGSAIVVKGPTVPEGFAATYKPDGPNKMDYTIKYKDKDTNKGVMSVNGKTLTDTSWVPGKENEKSIAIYDKQ
jgi:hypothetical protein